MEDSAGSTGEDSAGGVNLIYFMRKVSDSLLSLPLILRSDFRTSRSTMCCFPVLT